MLPSRLPSPQKGGTAGEGDGVYEEEGVYEGEGAHGRTAPGGAGEVATGIANRPLKGNVPQIETLTSLQILTRPPPPADGSALCSGQSLRRPGTCLHTVPTAYWLPAPARPGPPASPQDTCVVSTGLSTSPPT